MQICIIHHQYEFITDRYELQYILGVNAITLHLHFVYNDCEIIIEKGLAMDKFQLYAFADEAGSEMDAQIRALLRNGLNGLEIRGIDGENVSVITCDKAKEVRKKLDDNGLVTWSIGSPIGKIRLDEDFEAHQDLLRHTLDVANILGAKNMRIFSFYMPKDSDPSVHRQLVMDRMGKLLEIAEKSGVALCHENEKGIYGDTSIRCRDLLDTLPKLKGIFDPANFVQSGEDTIQAWERLKDRIYYLHIKDSLEDSCVVPAGLGAGNIPYIVKEYLARGDKAMTLEPHLVEFDGLKDLEESGDVSVVGKHFSYSSADAAFDAACAALKKILAEV